MTKQIEGNTGKGWWYADALQKGEMPLRPRLMFGLDATLSRQPTWNQATEMQAEMFKAAGTGIDVKLIYFRGSDECRASPWLKDTETLLAMMRKIECVTGLTQIGRVLAHALKETQAQRMRGLVYVGDQFEESIGDMRGEATALGKLETPVFMFQEGDDKQVAKAFMEIAHLSGGVYASFDASSPDRLKGQLKDILRTVGHFVATKGDTKQAVDRARLTLSRSRDLVVR
jgi:hypothetical protein